MAAVKFSSKGGSSSWADAGSKKYHSYQSSGGRESAKWKQGLGLQAQLRKKGIFKHLQNATSCDSSPCSKQLVLVGSHPILECGDKTEIAATTDNVSLHDLLMYLDCLIHPKGSAIVQLFPILRVI